jgi:hypothetical protein
MTNYNLDEIKKAVKIMELSDTATISTIKDRFKELIAQWHPDKCKEHPEKCKEMSQQINGAYETIMKYCIHYEISFKKEDIEKTMAKGDETWWLTRFGDDPVWGR